jgi:hypothetical protein
MRDKYISKRSNIIVETSPVENVSTIVVGVLQMLIINPILDMLTFQVSNIIKAMFNLER